MSLRKGLDEPPPRHGLGLSDLRRSEKPKTSRKPRKQRLVVPAVLLAAPDRGQGVLEGHQQDKSPTALTSRTWKLQVQQHDCKFSTTPSSREDFSSNLVCLTACRERGARSKLTSATRPLSQRLELRHFGLEGFEVLQGILSRTRRVFIGKEESASDFLLGLVELVLSKRVSPKKKEKRKGGTHWALKSKLFHQHLGSATYIIYKLNIQVLPATYIFWPPA